MPHVTVHKAEMPPGTAVSPFFLEAADTLDAIRKRAFELFEHRCGAPGDPLSDWLQAERDLFDIPPAEFVPTAEGYRMTVTLPDCKGVSPDVLARSHAIIVVAQSCRRALKNRRAKQCACAAADPKPFYRRFDLPEAIDVDTVTANAEKGVLTVEASRKGLKAMPVPLPLSVPIRSTAQVCLVAA